MPYIEQWRRDQLDVDRRFVADQPVNAGELNYVLTGIALAYIAQHSELRYALINDVVGAFECAKHEMYRRLAAPYEDQKAIDNGDVYPAPPSAWSGQ